MSPATDRPDPPPSPFPLEWKEVKPDSALVTLEDANLAAPSRTLEATAPDGATLRCRVWDPGDVTLHAPEGAGPTLILEVLAEPGSHPSRYPTFSEIDDVARRIMPGWIFQLPQAGAPPGMSREEALPHLHDGSRSAPVMLAARARFEMRPAPRIVP